MTWILDHSILIVGMLLFILFAQQEIRSMARARARISDDELMRRYVYLESVRRSLNRYP